MGESVSKPLGLWSATALVTGNMIGSGVFLLPAALAAYGGVSVVGWICSAAGAVTIALVFAGLARQVRGSGGPYIYTRAAFGDLPGFLVAWGYWISIIAGNAAIAIALVGYLSVFFPSLDESPEAASITTLVLLWMLVGVNVRGLKEAGRLQLITTVLKLLPLIGVGTVGLFFLEPSHFEPFNLSGESTASAVTATAALTLWAFLGVECANIPAGEVENPERNVPRAAIAGTLLAALVYIPSTVAVMGLVEPAVLADSPAPFADAAARLWGSWGYYMVAAGAVISCFGALNGWTLCLGQVPLAAATDGLFPATFKKLSRSGTPAAGIAVSTLLVSGLVMMNYSRSLVDQFTFVILLSTLTALLPYLLCSLARIVLAIRSGDKSALSPLDFLVSALATSFSIWAIVGSGVQTIAWGGVLLLVGLPVYAWILWRRPL
jgi:APA family basic amino acid/polyamine antiporter